MTASPVQVCQDPEVIEGPLLLSGLDQGPGLAAHLRSYGPTPRTTTDSLLAAAESTALRGRGGAAFPFATKLRATAEGRRRPVVVVNLSEGEPASSKDTALARHRPHLVLDGAAATARALGAREVHVVLPGDRPRVVTAVETALAERRDRVRWVRHVASSRFVAGQARAVLELMAGRPNLPVTAWQPEAFDGHRSRPTLLSNAETWAHVGRLLHAGPAHGLGTPEEPGTTLVTVRIGPAVVVCEVEYGMPLAALLPSSGDPAVLLGGFHGTWTTAARARRMRISVTGLREAGCTLGAGVVLVSEECPVTFTQRTVDYLAGQSAGRCGPCRFGLPELARALANLDDEDSGSRVARLAGLVDGRGACAHPDGTARLVGSLLRTFPDEVDLHRAGRCGWRRPRVVRRVASVAS